MIHNTILFIFGSRKKSFYAGYCCIKTVTAKQELNEGMGSVIPIKLPDDKTNEY
jgi:hypothetical protein